MKTWLFDTPLGQMIAREEEEMLTSLGFLDEGDVPAALSATTLLLETQRQINAYFSRTLKQFTLPLKLRGTPFQMAVWNHLREVPYGQTVTYGQLARQAGNPKSARPVGGAMHRNPIGIIVPCHRVVGAEGRLTGYGGGLFRKQALLNLEQLP